MGAGMFRIITTVGALLAVADMAQHGLAGGSGEGAVSRRDPVADRLPAGGIRGRRGTTFYVGWSRTVRSTAATCAPATARSWFRAAGRSAPASSSTASGSSSPVRRRAARTVYDARTGALLKTYQFATAPTFINDVVVTRDAAYFTDSSKPVLYQVPDRRRRHPRHRADDPLGGDYTQVAGSST